MLKLLTMVVKILLSYRIKRFLIIRLLINNGNHLYQSFDGLASILIENYDQQNFIVKPVIGHSDTLNNEQLNGLIDFIAAFDHKAENANIDLVTYLPTFNADFSVASTI